MKRLDVAAVMIVAALTVACGGENGGEIDSPTSPSQNCSVPGAPGNLAASVNGTRVMLTWSAVSGAADYVIAVGSTSGALNLLRTNTTQTNYSWTGAPVGMHYARVEARNACGTSRASNEVAYTVTGN